MLPESVKQTLRQLRQHELTSDLVTRSQLNITDKQGVTPVIIRKDEGVFFPSYVDKLYWCFFIMDSGMESYQALGKKVFSSETASKIALVTEIRENAQALVAHKKKCAIAEAETDLVGCPFISLGTFEVLCIVRKLNVVVVSGKRAVRFPYSDDDAFVIWNKEKGYGIGKERLSPGVLPDGVVEVQDLDKPLKALSSYKKDDLVLIASRVGVSTCGLGGKAKTKQALYQDILEVL